MASGNTACATGSACDTQSRWESRNTFEGSIVFPTFQMRKHRPSEVTSLGLEQQEGAGWPRICWHHTRRQCCTQGLSLLLPSYVTVGKSFQLSNPQLRG